MLQIQSPILFLIAPDEKETYEYREDDFALTMYETHEQNRIISFTLTSKPTLSYSKIETKMNEFDRNKEEINCVDIISTFKKVS